MVDNDYKPRSAATDPERESAKNDNSSKQSIPKLKPNTKLYRTMSALLERSFNRFESARLLHDHALHSTVSTIQNKYGIRVDRCDETVPGYQGAPTRVCRYWIAKDQQQRAYALLGVSR